MDGRKGAEKSVLQYGGSEKQKGIIGGVRKMWMVAKSDGVEREMPDIFSSSCWRRYWI